MPYTPPAQLSPGASKPTTPAISRNGSCTNTSESSSHTNLPRSTSYIHRHRRTPSVSKSPTSFASPRPTVKLDCRISGVELDTSEDGRDQSTLRPSTSLHQSPPPVSDAVMPAGAVISPPDSAQNSSDDEAGNDSSKRKGRHLDNLAELKEAIRIIEQRRESSPRRNPDSGNRELDEDKEKLAMELTESPVSFQPSRQHSGALSKEARKISHSRSSTESSIVLDLARTAESSESNSDIEDDAYRLAKPAMVRKKSGELVKPALRPSHARRPSSMPGTPTYSKAVHFDSHLEHVRHFLQVDRPLAVSAGSSPVEAYDGENEFPFSSDDNYRLREPPFEWEIVLPNFPRESVERKILPVRIERVFLSSDNKTLIGIVAVANIAFNKRVTARFTFDYWKTTSEVIAEYNNDVRRKQREDGYDRFNFNIKLEDQANLEKKTLFFCVRYNVNGQEFWDNNNGFNYQVDFKKKAKPQHGKNGMQGASARPLPRSRPSPTSTGRPVSLPASFDDFVDSLDSRYDFAGFKKQPPTRIIDDAPNPDLRLKSPKPTTGASKNSHNSPPTQAFGNRYDFGASLTAAIQAANNQLGDRSGVRMRDDPKPTKSAPSGRISDNDDYFKSAPAPMTASTSQAPASATKVSSKADFKGEKPPLQSTSYNEFLDKYCFFGSVKPSPQLVHTTRLPSGLVDGPGDDSSVSDYSIGGSRTSGSASPSPPRESSPLMTEHAVPRSESPRLSRSTSPAPLTGPNRGSRTTSPASFYPYHVGLAPGFLFSESHTPTAIKG